MSFQGWLYVFAALGFVDGWFVGWLFARGKENK